jgi:hypothetical protein
MAKIWGEMGCDAFKKASLFFCFEKGELMLYSV